MRKLSIEVPDDLVFQMGESDLAKESQWFLALKFFELGRLTSSQAAEMCKMSEQDFLAAARSDEMQAPELPEPQSSPKPEVDPAERRSQVSTMNYRVVIEADENGIFAAECPALPGCFAHGKTRAEALVNIKAAMTRYLASLKEQGSPAPLHNSKEIVEVPI